MTTKHALQLLIESSEADLAQNMRSYSGRSMYGRDCLALDGDLHLIMTNLVAAALYEGESFSPTSKDEILNALSALRTDQMGRGMIVYFPTVEFVTEDVEETDED